MSHDFDKSKFLGNRLRIWDISTSQLLRLIRDRAPILDGGYLCDRLAFSPDSKLLASGNWEGTVTIREPETGRLLDRLVCPSSVEALAFSPDGNILAVGSIEKNLPPLGRGGLRLWDINKRRWFTTSFPNLSNVTALAFSSDSSRLAVGMKNGHCSLLDLKTGDVIETMDAHLHNGIVSIAIAPDGKTLATASADNTVKFWDLP